MPQKYAFSSKPPRKKKEFCKLSANYPISVIYKPIIVSRSKLSPGGPSPHNMAKTSDGPPTIKRSGSEHRRAVTSSLFGQERLGERCGAFLKGKEGRVGFRKTASESI